MTNFIYFANAFLSYLLVFFVFLILIICGILVGIKMRKNKNKKEELAQAASNVEEAFVKKEESDETASGDE